MDFIDEVINIIRSSPDIPTSKQRLMERFAFDDVQATAIVQMRIGQLSGLERQKIEDELNALHTRIAELEGILADEGKIKAIVKDECLKMRDKYGDERRTAISAVSGEVDIEDLIPVDETFGAIGEATFYLTAEWVFTEEAERWIVIGNSDAFVLWLNGREVIRRDECRCWQPHCHAEIVTFKKGINRVALKLTRRTEKLRFSLGIRCYEGKHYHQMPWDTHYACIKQIL